jgi:hypothetical protein
MSNSLALDAIALTELEARLPDDVGAVAWKIAGYVLLEAVTRWRAARNAVHSPIWNSVAISNEDGLPGRR